MSRHDPHRRRRRPGRRPPHRFRGRSPAPPARGFTGPGFKQLYDLVLPWQGRQRKAFFNKISGGLVLACGLGGAALGASGAGPLGAVLGFGLGIATGGVYVETRRCFRP